MTAAVGFRCGQGRSTPSGTGVLSPDAQDVPLRSGVHPAAWNVPGRKDEDDVSQAGCGSASDVGASAASSCSIEVRIS